MGYTRIKVEDAARQLGISCQAVRLGMQKKTIPIGKTFCNGNKKRTYVPFQELLDEYIKGDSK